MHLFSRVEYNWPLQKESKGFNQDIFVIQEFNELVGLCLGLPKNCLINHH